jgi:hypothetical protein
VSELNIATPTITKKTAIANIRQHQFVQNIGLEQKKNQLIYMSVDQHQNMLNIILQTFLSSFHNLSCILLTEKNHQDILSMLSVEIN